MDVRMLLTSACVLGFAGAFAAGKSAYRALARVFSAARMQSPAMEEGVRNKDLKPVAKGVFAYVLRNGVEAFDGIARRMEASGRVGGALRDAARLAQQRGYTASPRSIASTFCLALVVAGCVCVLVSRSLLAGVLVPAFLALAASAVLAHEKEREQEALREQVPDALRCMEACLHAGLSLPQAFAEVASEVPSPAKDSFARVSHDLKLGYSMDEALARFHRLSGLPELGFVAMALDVQYVCGGSATPILRSAEDSVAHGLELRRSLRVQTAQARLSAQVVSIMPFFLLALLSLISPGFLNPFFADAQGVAVLVTAVAMQAAGVLMVRRMLAVEL